MTFTLKLKTRIAKPFFLTLSPLTFLLSYHYCSDIMLSYMIVHLSGHTTTASIGFSLSGQVFHYTVNEARACAQRRSTCARSARAITSTSINILPTRRVCLVSDRRVTGLRVWWWTQITECPFPLTPSLTSGGRLGDSGWWWVTRSRL